MKTVFGSVIYTSAIKYAYEFFFSLKNQTEEGYDILLINDNLSKDELKKCYSIIKEIGLKQKVTIVDAYKSYTISELRILLLREAKNRGYSFLIIGDFDDTFCENRVYENVKQYDSKYTFFYNDIYLPNGQIMMKEIPESIIEITPILEENFLGLSNTAINLENISIKILNSFCSINTNIFDWYFYSRVLLDDGKGKRINGCKTIYRQHAENIAGISKTNDIKNLLYEKDVKIKHYKLLKSYHPIYVELTNKYKRINVEQEFFERKYYNRQMKGFWWEKIKLEDNDV